MGHSIPSLLSGTRISVFEKNEKKLRKEIRDDVAASEITGLKVFRFGERSRSH